MSILTPEQTQYYFLSGFTAKLAGTERGITEPTPTFSACFGQAFLELHPTKYAEELVKKMEKSAAPRPIWSTPAGTAPASASPSRTPAASSTPSSDGDILTAPTKKIPYFNFEVPTELPRRRPPTSWIPATPTPTPPSGTRRPRIWPPASSRTSPSTKATKRARLWSPPARSSESEQQLSPDRTFPVGIFYGQNWIFLENQVKVFANFLQLLYNLVVNQFGADCLSWREGMTARTQSGAFWRPVQNCFWKRATRTPNWRRF